MERWPWPAIVERARQRLARLPIRADRVDGGFEEKLTALSYRLAATRQCPHISNSEWLARNAEAAGFSRAAIRTLFGAEMRDERNERRPLQRDRWPNILGVSDEEIEAWAWEERLRPRFRPYSPPRARVVRLRGPRKKQLSRCFWPPRPATVISFPIPSRRPPDPAPLGALRRSLTVTAWTFRRKAISKDFWARGRYGLHQTRDGRLIFRLERYCGGRYVARGQVPDPPADFVGSRHHTPVLREDVVYFRASLLESYSPARADRALRLCAKLVLGWPEGSKKGPRRTKRTRR